MAELSEKTAARAAIHAIRAFAAGLNLPSSARIGPAVVVGGLILNSEHDWIDETLRRYGVRNAAAIRNTLVKTAESDAELPRVQLDASLPSSVKELVSRLREGQDTCRELLETLLTGRHDETLWLLRDPLDFLHCYRGAGSGPDGKGDFLRKLARFYGPRLAAANRYLCVQSNENGVAELARSDASKSVVATSRRLGESRWKAEEEFFCRPVYYRSPFGECWAEHGEVSGHVFAITVLCELGLVGNGPPTVRELAGAISLENIHRFLRLVQKTIQDELNGCWTLVPERRGYLWFGMPVLPHPDALDRVVTYLADEPIDKKEISALARRNEAIGS